MASAVANYGMFTMTGGRLTLNGTDVYDDGAVYNASQAAFASNARPSSASAETGSTAKAADATTKSRLGHSYAFLFCRYAICGQCYQTSWDRAMSN